MNTARALLDDLAVIGATVKPAGDRLILRAGSIAIPATLVNRVREAKTDLIATLVRHETCLQGPSAESECQSGSQTQLGIVEWLNQHPAPSAPGRCDWCGRLESRGAVVLPFGAEQGTHTWLHAECWPAWHQSRQAEAALALKRMGIAVEESDDPG